MGGGENPTCSLIFSKMLLFLFRIFFMHMWYYYVVKKLVVGTQCIYRRSGSNYSLQLKYLQKAQTAVLTSTSCDKLLVAVTQHMTELAAGRVYTATPCTRLVYYTERVSS